MSKVFDPIRARSSLDALEMICRQHPECGVNALALSEELAAADEQIEQLARALREAVEPPTFMGEPIAQSKVVAWFNPANPNAVINAAQYPHVLPKNKVGYLPCIVAAAGVRATSTDREWKEFIAWQEELRRRPAGVDVPEGGERHE
jgi:hypothetical protein